MHVNVGNASLVECICECCKANCVTNVTNETVCSDSLCLMWPHGLSVWRTDGRLVSTACAMRTAVRAIVGPAIGSVVIICRRAGISLTSGRCRANRRESGRFDSVVVVVVQCVA